MKRKAERIWKRRKKKKRKISVGRLEPSTSLSISITRGAGNISVSWFRNEEGKPLCFLRRIQSEIRFDSLNTQVFLRLNSPRASGEWRHLNDFTKCATFSTPLLFLRPVTSRKVPKPIAHPTASASYVCGEHEYIVFIPWFDVLVVNGDYPSIKV